MATTVEKFFKKMVKISLKFAITCTLITFFFNYPSDFTEEEINSYTELAKKIMYDGAYILSTNSTDNQLPEYTYISLGSNKLMFITYKGTISFSYDSLTLSISKLDVWVDVVLISILTFCGSFMILLFILVCLYDLITKKKTKSNKLNLEKQE